MNCRTVSLLLAVIALSLSACGGDTAGTPTIPELDTGGTNAVTQDAGNNTIEDASAEDTAPDGEPDLGIDMGPVACTSANDCPAPEICIFDLGSGEAYCGEPTGDGGTGDECSSGPDCASGLCVGGLCAEPCGTEADCPSGFTCQPTDVLLTDGSVVQIDACVPEVPVCSSNTDCADPTVCVVDLTGNAATLECRDPVGGGAIGDACGSDSECASNLCIDGACSAPCETSSDCSTDGSFLCESETLQTGGGPVDLTVCTPRPPEQCLSDSDCTGAERCVASKTATDVEFACGAPNAGGAEAGAACLDDTDCAQNLCHDGTCSAPCESTGDCAGAADYTCRVTPIDLGNGATDSGQICVAPTACQDDSVCRTAMGEVCYVRETPNALDAICRQPNVGGGDLGQVCTGDSACANNLCLDTRFRDVCTVPCSDDADCGVSGYGCEQVTIDLAGGGSETIGICTPDDPPACSSETDCATGLDCVVIENEAGTALESVCVPTTGGDATGVVCNEDDDCASLVCLNGFCAAPCEDANECGPGQLCLANDITRGAHSGTFDVCETLPDEQCTSTDDCSDGVRVCSDVRSVGGTDTAFCEFPRNGGAQLGSQCATFSDCRENICLLGISNECSVVCDKDADCGAGQGCTTFGGLNYCNTSCADDDDCAGAGNVCTINGDEITNDVDQICVEPVGANLLGDTCTSGGDCVSGLCLRTLSYNGVTCNADTDCNAAADESCECPVDDPGCTTGKECATIERRCTAVCDDGGDCAGGVAQNPLTSCNPNIYVPRPDNTPKQISACARP